MMKNYYLLTTAHLEDGIWFRNDEDFSVGMNFVAIQATQSRVNIMAFILMSNHTHFVLKGLHADVLEFITQFKHRYSIYLRIKYGIKKFLQRNDVDIQELQTEDESLERAIAYVQMNSVAANICLSPLQYPWGTGNLFFNQTRPKGKVIGELSQRELGRLLHSDCRCLPENWLIGDEGYIFPQMYVDILAVEACFRTAKRMNYFLTNSSKAKRRLEHSGDNLPAFRDQLIKGAIPDLCQSLFQKSYFSELNPDEQQELLRQIRFRFSANVNQIARVCDLTYAEAARLLDGF